MTTNKIPKLATKSQLQAISNLAPFVSYIDASFVIKTLIRGKEKHKQLLRTSSPGGQGEISEAGSR